MAEHQYIQLPPDSTGKKIMHRAEVILLYNNGVVAFAVGDKVYGVTSGAIGDVTKISGTVSSGEIHINMDSQSVTAFIDSEDLEVDSVKKAEANGVGIPQFIPATILMSGETAENSAVIDANGSLQMRYASGNPALDITGRQEVVNPVTIGEYTFKYDGTGGGEVAMATDGTASGTYLPNQNAVTMQVGTSSGDFISAQTNIYHIFPLGVSYGAIFSLWVGDTGKANCRRRWGLFDADDGWFFEVNGTTLNVVQRSSATGSLVEWRVPQSSWNQDTLDGSENDNNPSKLTIDVSKTNIYFIETAGNGGVTFGVYLLGERVVMHSFVHAGYFSGVAVGQNSQFPLRAELENTGNTASTSEITIVVGVVLANTTIGSLYNVKRGSGEIYTESKSISTDWSHLYSIRAAKLYQGKNNRGWIFPDVSKFFSDTQPVILGYSILSVVDGTWTQSGLAEYITDSTSSFSGFIIGHDIVVANEVKELNKLPEEIGASTSKLTRKANIDDTPTTIHIWAKTLSGTTNLTFTSTWKEIY